MIMFNDNWLSPQERTVEEAERGVLAAMLRSDDAVRQAMECLTAEDFSFGIHRMVYTIMQELKKQDVAVSLDTVSKVFLADKPDESRESCRLELEAIIASTRTDTTHLLDDIATVRNDATTRRNFAEEHLYKAGTPLMDAFEQLNRIYERQKFPGIPTGFASLDASLGGWQEANLIIMAGRPSMGKTTFAMNSVLFSVLRGHTALFFTTEMEKKQWMNRLLCIRGQIEWNKLMTGTLDDSEWERLVVAGDQIHAAPLYLDDSAYLTIDDIAIKARRLKEARGLDFIVIDYLQMVHGSPRKPYENRYQEMADISRALKSLAKELHIPVIALSQLSRSVESRLAKRPMLPDLRDSGTLEEDADVILFLYREEVYEPEPEPEKKNALELILAKNRFGTRNVMPFHFNPSTGSIHEILPPEE